MVKDDTDPPESLGSIAKRVSVGFGTLDIGTLPDNNGSCITNERQRFELWAVNLGLYHGGHSSLDYRFRDSPPLLSYAYRLLRELENGVASVKASLDDDSNTKLGSHDDHNSFDDSQLQSESDDDDSEEDFSSYQTVSPTQAHIENVTISIDRLYRLSFKIRRPAMRIGISKALKYREVDPDTGVNLFDTFALLDKRHMLELFRSYGHQDLEALHSNYLVQRLARANTRRRQQFRYWARRKVKYEIYSSEPTVSQNTPDPGAGTVMKRTNKSVNESRQALSKPSTATWLNAAQIDLEDNGSVISTRTFLVMDEKSDDRCCIPPAPNIGSDTKEFECPFCFTICPSTILAKGAWETHVFRDLRPYVCTFEHCKEPDQQYDTLADWISHELSNHGVNVIQNDHYENPRDCPICLKPNQSPVHIAGHLRRISCFSLPQLTGERESSVLGSRLSNQAGFLTHNSDRSSLGSVSWGAWDESVSAQPLSQARATLSRVSNEESNTDAPRAESVPASEPSTSGHSPQEDRMFCNACGETWLLLREHEYDPTCPLCKSDFTEFIKTPSDNGVSDSPEEAPQSTFHASDIEEPYLGLEEVARRVK